MPRIKTVGIIVINFITALQIPVLVLMSNTAKPKLPVQPYDTAAQLIIVVQAYNADKKDMKYMQASSAANIKAEKISIT